MMDKIQTEKLDDELCKIIELGIKILHDRVKPDSLLRVYTVMAEELRNSGCNGDLLQAVKDHKNTQINLSNESM